MRIKKLMAGFFHLFLIIIIIMASPLTAQAGDISIGLFGGGAWSIVSEAVKGFPETEFKSSPVYGVSLLYRFPNGIALELCAKNLEMELEETGNKFGKLKMTPVLFLLKFQGKPISGSGLSGHFDLGGGINFTSFEKGGLVTDLERAYGVQYTIDTDNNFVFETGGGFDYFFTKNISINLDIRLMVGNVDTTWKASGGGGSTTLNDIDTFQISNIQGLLGLRFWF
jgi:outer membrane protein W